MSLELLTKPPLLLLGREPRMGDRFRTQNSRIVTLTHSEPSDTRYPWGTSGGWYAPDGSFCLGEVNPRDLIKYLEPETPND